MGTFLNWCERLSYQDPVFRLCDEHAELYKGAWWHTPVWTLVWTSCIHLGSVPVWGRQRPWKWHSCFCFPLYSYVSRISLCFPSGHSQHFYQTSLCCGSWLCLVTYAEPPRPPAPQSWQHLLQQSPDITTRNASKGTKCSPWRPRGLHSLENHQPRGLLSKTQSTAFSNSFHIPVSMYWNVCMGF